MFDKIENVSPDAFPVKREYIQLESARGLATSRARRSRGVRLLRTKYQAKSVTIVRVDDNWIGIGIGVGVGLDKISWVGNRPSTLSVVIATPQEPTFIKAQKGGEYIGLNVSLKLAESIVAPMPVDLFIKPRSLEVPPIVHERVLSDLVDLFDRSDSEFELRTKSLLRLVFCNIKDSPSVAVGDTQLRYVHSTIDFIRQKVVANAPFSVKQVAFSIGCSSRTLEYAFKRHLGISPKQYIDLYRLNRFHDRIKGRTKSEIYHIIHIMGYSNASRILKQHNEFFPSEF